MVGLLHKDMQYIKDAATNVSSIETIILFGSRALGNYKRGSDVDLCLKGKHLTEAQCIQFSDYLNEEAPLPYFFDVINYHEVTNIKLRQHIDQLGVMIYEK